MQCTVYLIVPVSYSKLADVLGPGLSCFAETSFKVLLLHEFDLSGLLLNSNLSLAACAVVLLLLVLWDVVELFHSVSASGGKCLPLGRCLVHD